MKNLGEGMVVTLEGQGEHTRVQIHFSEVGTKWIIPAYARLEMI